jgi:VanZ family protein
MRTTIPIGITTIGHHDDVPRMQFRLMRQIRRRAGPKSDARATYSHESPARRARLGDFNLDMPDDVAAATAFCYRRPMFKRRALWLRVAFVMSAGLALAVTPFESKFERANKTCELRPQLDMLLPSLLNPRHILAFSVLAALASVSLERRPGLTAWLLVLVLSASIEIEQLYFVSGHCRVRDLLPNIVAATLGISVARGIRVLRQRHAQS